LLSTFKNTRFKHWIKAKKGISSGFISKFCFELCIHFSWLVCGVGVVSLNMTRSRYVVVIGCKVPNCSGMSLPVGSCQPFGTLYSMNCFVPPSRPKNKWNRNCAVDITRYRTARKYNT
jgi:hypothetical protein